MPEHQQRQITDEQFHDATLIWNYHQMGHAVRPCAAAIGPGSHDLGVATTVADLYRAGLFPVAVFSGGNSPTTRARFPRGEAVHYREHALSLGVPDEAILVEPKAANTGQNITFSRELMAEASMEVESLLLISEPLELDDYIKLIGDEMLVVAIDSRPSTTRGSDSGHAPTHLPNGRPTLVNQALLVESHRSRRAVSLLVHQYFGRSLACRP
ncbi:YdcF family protein [Streptomyces sp. NPDC005808]|uniref:YdcF family protein n=1 Tax=Streptomyces sp. NPDC005808 TaxID=3364734 RepID=UPI0036A7A43F